MDMRSLGRTGVEVSACCLGTMTWGEQNTEAEAFEQMNYAVEHGVNFFDAAELYPIPPKADTQGRTESIIGAWIEERGRRDDIILATKITGRSPMSWFRDDKAPTRITRAQLSEAIEKSLKRLQTDYIDLYQIHWPDRAIDLFGERGFRDYAEDYETFENQLEALSAHIDAGKIRFIGLSNETPWGVARFLDAAEARGWPRIASIQNAYNLVNRTFENGLAEMAMREDVGLLAYSPLAQGCLTGKYRGGASPKGSRKALFDRMQRYEGPGAEKAIEAYCALAEASGVDPGGLALSFVASRPFCTSAIIGATTMDQLKTNIDAFALDWKPDWEDAVNGLEARFRSPCP